MAPVITIFVDEAGDPGTRDGLHYEAGRHEWFCLSALAVQSMREREVVDWVRDLRQIASAKQSDSLHYTRITQERREGVCSELATKPVRAFCLASHKSNLRQYSNPKLGHLTNSQTFYNWCTRLLLERVTDWVERWHRKHRIAPVPIEVIFARRGGHRYDRMFAYFDILRMQTEASTKVLSSRGLRPPFLDRTHWRVEAAESLAGLQLADVVASAIYQAANRSSPAWDVLPALALKPIFAKDGKGDGANTGLTVFPLQHQAPIPEESQRLFEEFGYKF